MKDEQQNNLSLKNAGLNLINFQKVWCNGMTIRALVKITYTQSTLECATKDAHFTKNFHNNPKPLTGSKIDTPYLTTL